MIHSTKQRSTITQQHSSDHHKQFTLFEQLIDISYASNATHDSGSELTLLSGNTLKTYTLQRWKTDDDALCPVVLVPTQSTSNAIDIKILFKGSDNLSGMYASISGEHGAGYNCFVKNKKKIISKLENLLNNYKHKDIHLTLAGHSLGGSFAQNTIVEIMHRLCASGNKLSHLKHLELVAFNSGGVPKAIASQSHRLAGEMLKRNVTLAAWLLIVGGDPIQQTGESMVFNDLLPIHGTVILAKVKTIFENQLYTAKSLTEIVTGSLQAHNKHWVTTTSPDKLGIDYYSSQVPEERKIIRCELLTKIATTMPGIYHTANNLKTVVRVSKDIVEKAVEDTLPKIIEKTEHFIQEAMPVAESFVQEVQKETNATVVTISRNIEKAVVHAQPTLLQLQKVANEANMFIQETLGDAFQTAITLLPGFLGQQQQPYLNFAETSVQKNTSRNKLK